MHWESWLMFALSAVVIPSAVWLLRLHIRVAELEQKYLAMQVNCERHQKWNADHQRRLERIDRNLVRLCMRSEIEYESGD